MQPAQYDLSVLLIFFARPNTLRKVFEQVKRARPSRLFLACDGPRDHVPTERERVEECKKIVSGIDWDCQVYTHYSDVNLGCGKGPERAISWAFAYTDELVVLEDDCVPDDTLFPYMQEMLARYRYDTRVGMISGFNHFCEWDCGGNSYCFTKYGATLGWGTWKRVWDNYDFYIKGVQDEYYRDLLKNDIPGIKARKERIGSWLRAAEETPQKKVNYWDIQFGFVKYSQSYLCVVPKNNLIYNIGVGLGSTHTESNKVVNWKLGEILFMPTKSLEFPLVHPKYIICDRNYDKICANKILHKSFLKKAGNKIKRMLGK